jgi:hypothetical protein
MAMSAILLAVYSPSKDRAIIMPHEVAEEAAQTNFSRYYRRPRLDGGTRQPGKVWLALEGAKSPRKPDPDRIGRAAFCSNTRFAGICSNSPAKSDEIW